MVSGELLATHTSEVDSKKVLGKGISPYIFLSSSIHGQRGHDRSRGLPKLRRGEVSDLALNADASLKLIW